MQSPGGELVLPKFLNQVLAVPRVPKPTELSWQSRALLPSELFWLKKLPELPTSMKMPSPLLSLPVSLTSLPRISELVSALFSATMPSSGKCRMVLYFTIEYQII